MASLVTGGTGLLGGSIVRALVDRDEEVVCLVRSADRARHVLGALPVRLREGDLAALGAHRSWWHGIDTVYSCAAYFREYYAAPRAAHQRALEAVNVSAVRDLLRSADGAGVTSVVHVSTSGLHGGTPDCPADEQSPPDPIALRNLYHRSKARSEEVVRELATQLSVRVPVVRPGWMFGPGDAAPTGSGRLVLDIALGRLPFVPPGGHHATDARDVAAACLRAAERGRSGEAFIVAAPWRSMAAVVADVAEAAGVPSPRLRLPRAAALPLATASAWAAGARGVPPRASPEAVRTLTAVRRLTSAKAERELDATFRSFQDTARDEIAWYRRRGDLPNA